MGDEVAWLDGERANLRKLFDVLGSGDHWVDDDVALIEFMERTWLGSEHGEQLGKPVFTDDQQAAALPILTDMGFVDRVEPRRSRYDEILLLGASAIGLHRRLELIRKTNVAASRLTVLAGLRPHERQARDGSLSELMAPDGRFAAAPGWEPPATLAHQARLLGETDVDDYLAAAALLPHETALARLLIAKQWPDVRPVGTEHQEPHPIENELGQRHWVTRTYATSGAVQEIRILNGAPVQRGDRPPPADHGQHRDRMVDAHRTRCSRS